MEKNNILIPISILIAGALITWGVMSDNQNKDTEKPVVKQEQTTKTEVAAVTTKDHLLGDPNADIIIVEYSDLECPFCKNFYFTTKKIMEEYGKDGKVALVFRQFPIDQLHSNARKEAIATECANELGGNAKFWEYLDLLYKTTPSNNRFDTNKLPELATEIGLNKEDFTKCLDNTDIADKVKKQQETGIKAGVRGTPSSYIMNKKGNVTPINGAQPYQNVKLMIESALK